MKTIKVTIEKEVEPCERCGGYTNGDMHSLMIASSKSDTVITTEDIVLFHDLVCGKCRDIIINSLTKRTRNPNPTTTKDGGK